ncbi:MAG: hypothetical protein JO102_04655 [Elusimicrobia bacterium]|nr:hypothetical protein [Elusimicrobiota bacterium]
MKIFRAAAFAVFALVLSGVRPARADESPFGYIYTADLLPKGRWEYEQWNTLRGGKARGKYTALDIRNEAEYGFTDRFSGALYLNSSYNRIRGVPDSEDPTVNLPKTDRFDVNGVSVELKYRVLSPYKDPIGLVLYVEPELEVRNAEEGVDEIARALEFKLILQKNFFQDRLVFASNLTAEPEWERMPDGSQNREARTEASIGGAYRVVPGWTVGLELLSRHGKLEQVTGDKRYSALFFGPSVHYTRDAWWGTLTLLPQIGGTPHSLGADASGIDVKDPSRFLGNQEKVEVRFRFGYNF